MAATPYTGPWPAGSLVAYDGGGHILARWDGAQWQLTGGGTAPPGKLSATLGVQPARIVGVDQLAGVRWDWQSRQYVRDTDGNGNGNTPTSLGGVIPAQYGGGDQGIGGTAGGAVGGLVGGALGGQQTGQKTEQLGSLVGQGVQSAVVELSKVFS